MIIVVALAAGDYRMPSKKKIKLRQDALTRRKIEVATSLGTVTRSKDRLYHVPRRSVSYKSDGWCVRTCRILGTVALEQRPLASGNIVDWTT